MKKVLQWYLLCCYNINHNHIINTYYVKRREKLWRTDKQIQNELTTILRWEILAKMTKDDVPFKWIWNFLVLRSGSECYQKQETRVPAGGSATPGPCCCCRRHTWRRVHFPPPRFCHCFRQMGFPLRIFQTRFPPAPRALQEEESSRCHWRWRFLILRLVGVELQGPSAEFLIRHSLRFPF